MSRLRPLGIVVALPIEAGCLGCHATRPGLQTLNDGAVQVAVAGMGLERARTAAALLADRGVGALLSFGTAAALDPGLAAGDLILPVRVVSAQGEGYDCDADWLRRLAAAAGSDARPDETLAHAPVILQGVEDKCQLRAVTGASAADMESLAIAGTAIERSLPFAVVRAIVDAAAQGIPGSVAAATAPDGRISLPRLAHNLIMRPTEFAALMRLMLSFGAAHRRLRRFSRVTQCDFASLAIRAERGHRQP